MRFDVVLYIVRFPDSFNLGQGTGGDPIHACVCHVK